MDTWKPVFANSLLCFNFPETRLTQLPFSKSLPVLLARYLGNLWEQLSIGQNQLWSEEADEESPEKEDKQISKKPIIALTNVPKVIKYHCHMIMIIIWLSLLMDGDLMRVMHPRILQWELNKQKFSQCSNGIKIKFTLQNRIQSIFLLNIKKYFFTISKILCYEIFKILSKFLSMQSRFCLQNVYYHWYWFW